jgi:hypothetical protein|tara:strand:+ start:1962 stop:2204 length:243 start_codon:yes stop_codon:yes gene_type:complete
MELPKLYSIKPWERKKALIVKITDHLLRLDVKKFPNICMQIENDNSKVELIDTIIVNTYSNMGVYSIKEALSTLEVTLNN